MFLSRQQQGLQPTRRPFLIALTAFALLGTAPRSLLAEEIVVLSPNQQVRFELDVKDDQLTFSIRATARRRLARGPTAVEVKEAQHKRADALPLKLEPGGGFIARFTPAAP